MERSTTTALESALGLLLLVATVSVNAQTVGAGPYYATPSWDQTLPVNTRFIVLSNMNSEAVLDRETGLVWQRSPDTSTRIWFLSSLHCLNSFIGGRKGWRLPGIAELASLIDPLVGFPGPTLPAGHPFQNVQSSHYWSATISGDDPTSTLAFDATLDFGTAQLDSKSHNFLAWCVRAGPGGDAQ